LKIRKVSPTAFETPAATATKELTPRQRARLELEQTIDEALRAAAGDADAAFRLTLDDGEKPATIRQAFNRVKTRTPSGADVNLISHDGELYIAKRPQRRGRRPKAA
jgi:hypothetical protein